MREFRKFAEDRPEKMNIKRNVRDGKPAARLRRIRAVVRALTMSLLLVAPAGHLCALAASGANATTQAGKITDPKVAAMRLYAAWRRKNRAAALKVAERETVDKLFGVRWRAMQSKGCERRDEGGFQCIYYDAKNDLSLSINVGGGASAGYGVESVSFSTEE
jgi:hypothetical protein